MGKSKKNSRVGKKTKKLHLRSKMRRSKMRRSKMRRSKMRRSKMRRTMKGGACYTRSGELDDLNGRYDQYGNLKEGCPESRINSLFSRTSALDYQNRRDPSSYYEDSTSSYTPSSESYESMFSGLSLEPSKPSTTPTSTLTPEEVALNIAKMEERKAQEEIRKTEQRRINEEAEKKEAIQKEDKEKKKKVIDKMRALIETKYFLRPFRYTPKGDRPTLKIAKHTGVQAGLFNAYRGEEDSGKTINRNDIEYDETFLTGRRPPNKTTIYTEIKDNELDKGFSSKKLTNEDITFIKNNMENPDFERYKTYMKVLLAIADSL